MTIEWRDKLSVGDPGIDADHKALIRLINDFESRSAQSLDRRTLSDTLKGLLDYAKEHFGREERLQARINYPFYDLHCHEHKRLIREVEQFARHYMTDPSVVIDEEAKASMDTFLRAWLIDHIIEQDLKMRAFLTKA